MKVTIVQHGSQLFAKNKEDDLLKIKGVVIPKKDKPTAYYDADTEFFKLICQPNTVHEAEYVCAATINIY